LGAIALRHTYLASRRNARLRIKGDALEKYLEHPESADLLGVLKELRLKWNSEIINSDKFEKYLEDISNEDTRRRLAPVIHSSKVTIRPLALPGAKDGKSGKHGNPTSLQGPTRDNPESDSFSEERGPEGEETKI